MHAGLGSPCMGCLQLRLRRLAWRTVAMSEQIVGGAGRLPGAEQKPRNLLEPGKLVLESGRIAQMLIVPHARHPKASHRGLRRFPAGLSVRIHVPPSAGRF